MRCLAFVLTITFAAENFNATAQDNNFQREINEQVWEPFIRSYNDLDTDGFMAVHSKNLARVLQDDHRVLSYKEYYNTNKLGNENAKKYFDQYNSSRTIELRFISRIANKEKAFESGYYKVTNTLADGQVTYFYGKFQVLLRKERKVWKILMDADAFDDTDESIFQTGEALNK